MRVVVTEQMSYVALPDLATGLSDYAADLEEKGVVQASEAIRIVVGFLLDYMLQAHAVVDPK